MLCCICSFNIDANNLISDSGTNIDKNESINENLDIKDFLFSQTDTLSNAPILIKHYAEKYSIIGSIGSKIEICPVELINLYNNELNSYIVFSINNLICPLVGKDVASIVKALEQMQSYVKEVPQLYQENLTFNYPVKEEFTISFGYIRKKKKDSWQGMVSLTSDEETRYCYFTNMEEKMSLLIDLFNSCVNQVEERLKNPCDRKLIAQYGQQNEPSVFYFDLGNPTKYILNCYYSETLNGEYCNMLYEQKDDKKLYRGLYNIARKSIWTPNATGRFGTLEAYINRNGEIVFSKLYINSNYTISKKNIVEMLDYLDNYKLFPFPSHFDSKVEFVRVYVPLFKYEDTPE